MTWLMVGEFLLNLQQYATYLAQFLGIVTIVITLVAKFTPTDLDDVKALKASTKLWKLISWLPTAGVNPRTKKLEEFYKNINGNQ